jgi:photosystem II stability/assembly factor-like uncharacterized protein
MLLVRLGPFASMPLLILSVLLPGPRLGHAHDSSAYGGLFRSRDEGATWLPANPGRVVSGAIALAVHPTEPTHLLLATDSGLLRSWNGGLDWTLEAPTLLVGPVFAVAFDATGQRAMAATGRELFRMDEGGRWRPASLPNGAAPVRALVVGEPGEVYLVGWRGTHHSADWGGSWRELAPGDPGHAPTALVRSPGGLYAVAEGRILVSEDAGASWRAADAGLPGGAVEALTLEGGDPRRAWVVARGQLFRSQDGGATWQPAGRPLPEAATLTRAIAVTTAGAAVTLTTDRGLYRSADGGRTWRLLTEGLPAHLEAWPLVRDPVDPATLYAGFALTPYLELWRLAAEGGTALGRLPLTSTLGGVAVLGLLALAAALALRLLARHAGRARA